MFKEVLHIIPKLSAAALNTMESSLGKRFTTIAKKFGKGLIGVLTGGGVAGLALGLVDKILNPLKETQEAIDRILTQGDDLVTNAKQFGTTSGKLFRLQQRGLATGMKDPGQFYMLIEKFQTAVAEAEADPEKPSSVRAFVGTKDAAEGFFQFIQSLQKLDKNQQLIAQKEVFGEKQILKMADFLQTDFAEQTRLLGGPSSETLTPEINNVGSLNDLKDLLEARRNLGDMVVKSKNMSEEMIKLQDQRARADLERENSQIKSYENLAAISNASNELLNLGREAALGIAGLVVKVTNLADNVKKMSDSRVVKGFLKLTGRGE